MTSAGFSLGGGIAGLALTTLILAVVSPTPVSVPAGLAAIVVPSLLAVGLAGGTRAWWIGLLGVGLSACTITCLWWLVTDGLPVRPYGDGAVLAQFVAEDRAMPRWLLGTALAGRAHALVWQAPSVSAWLPEQLRSASAFLSVLCAIGTVAGTFALWRRWPGQLSVVLPMLTPIWWLFASGYVEYYPLVAVGFLGVLAWVFERPLADRPAWAIGLVCGLLPVVYIGFLPTAAALGAVWSVARPRGLVAALGVACATAWLVVVACWPEGLVSFAQTLYAVMNVGEANLHPRYLGTVAGPASPMFSVAYALSPTHLREVAYLLAWGGGWWTWPLLAVAAVLATRACPGEARRDSRVWLGGLLVAWHAYYLVFMIPRLGLPADVDLFFSTYLLAPLLAGHLLDRSGAGRDPRVMTAVMALAWGSLSCTVAALIWHGLPPGP